LFVLSTDNSSIYVDFFI